MYAREESEYFRAKRKAAWQISGGEPKPANLPTNREIRDEIRALARRLEGRRRAETLRAMRVEALRVMRAVAAFAPRLVGSLAAGHAPSNSRIHLHLFCDDPDAVATALDAEPFSYHPRPGSGNPDSGNDEQPAGARIRIENRFPIELTVYAAAVADHVFRNTVTGRAIERAGLGELEELLARENSSEVSEEPLSTERQSASPPAETLDRFLTYQRLLAPLEHVKEDPVSHPEGDVLYHSLQVFALAREAIPYDEEFLLAALLHDVGKAVDRRDHVAASLEVLEGLITPRTAWLIEHHSEALAMRNGTLGVRGRRRLEAAESFDELMRLAECDAAGRQVGVAVPDVAEAIAYLREMDEACGE
jgi:predicted HD phosphohydrolase